MRVPMVWGDRRSDTGFWIEGPQKELDHHIGERVIRCTTSSQGASKSVVGSTLPQRRQHVRITSCKHVSK
jgi:hypothetical protein